ncbi:conserved hypothetical protein [Tepidicaulis marinus]|uniref:O-antigen ligase-related domain-containing protein n=2 Tax=Tepidicaulis marinus TaxID=1333998 RepID=A0A081BDP4_9HYPH|nr:conserved hypothetical protein [Tepidicaulis marinus]
MAGPIEWVVATVALIVIMDGLRRRELHKNPYIWGGSILLALLSLGGFWALIVDPARLGLRDTASYLFSFLVVMAFLNLARGREVVALAVLAVTIATYLIFAALVALIPNPFTPLMWHFIASSNEQLMWHASSRLQGFSDNPNQIAFLAVSGLGLLAYVENRAALSRKVIIPLAIGCVVVGAMTHSDSFFLALLTLMVVFFAIHIVEFVGGGRNGEKKIWKGNRPHTITCIFLLAFAGVLFVLLEGGEERLVSLDTESSGEEVAVDEKVSPGEKPRELNELVDRELRRVMAADAHQGTVRIELWKRAVSLGMKSPLVGYGPGYKLAPGEPNAIQEAHNTVLDLLLISGIVGLGGLLALVLLAIRGGLKNGHLAILIVMGTGVSVFAMFHYVGRQPVFWIIVFAIIYAASLDRVLKWRPGFLAPNRGAT